MFLDPESTGRSIDWLRSERRPARGDSFLFKWESDDVRPGWRRQREARNKRAENKFLDRETGILEATLMTVTKDWCANLKIFMTQMDRSLMEKEMRYSERS